MKRTGKKNADPSSKNISEKKQTKGKDKGEDDMEIVELPTTAKADAIFAESCTTVKVCVCNMNKYHQADLFVRKERVQDSDILLCDKSLSQVTSLRASFRMCGLAYSCDLVSVASHTPMGARDVTTLSRDDLIVGVQVLNSGGKVLLLYGR